MNTASISSIAFISDVSLGYGTPQILSLAQSLSEYFDADVQVFEPDQPERPRLDFDFQRVTVSRVFTSTHPYTLSGRYDYNIQVCRELDQMKPDIVVFAAFVGAGAILKMKHKPRMVIYYGLEHTDGTMWREMELMPLIAPKIDLAIFPEETRAMLDAPRLKLENTPSIILYNGSSVDVELLPARVRNNRMFYGGLIHPELTYGDWYLDGELDEFPIDMYGLIDGYTDKDRKIEQLAKREGLVTYNGYVQGGDKILDILRHYQFSIIMWAPVRESFQYAAPNKFFDAIQSGVPVVTAPHPLCKRLVERYNCGYVMDDWSLESLKTTMKRASLSRVRGEYEDMVELNLAAARKDLSWKSQFQKLAAFFDSHETESNKTISR